jgi:hypothetical protein
MAYLDHSIDHCFLHLANLPTVKGYLKITEMDFDSYLVDFQLALAAAFVDYLEYYLNQLFTHDR